MVSRDRKPRRARSAADISLRLWTGRVVEVSFVRASPGTTPCHAGRHCGHFTRTINFQCCHCGAEFVAVDPVERAQFQRDLDAHLERYPELEVTECEAAGVAFLLKQWVGFRGCTMDEFSAMGPAKHGKVSLPIVDGRRSVEFPR